MMRSNELSYCLESPHLWYDAAAPNLVAKDLENAEKYLKEGREKKDVIDQLNTAYQSMYFAAVALLHAIGYKSSHIRCVLTVLEDYYVKKGKLDRIQVDHFIQAQRLEGVPAENVELAAGFLTAVRKAMEKSQ